MTLTPTLVRKLAPGEYPDDVRRGLVLRVRDNGTRTFTFVYSKGGRNHRITLGEFDPESFTLADAREKALAIRRALLVGGAHPAEEKRQERRGGALTVEKMVLDRLAEANLAPSTAAEWERLAKVEIIPSPLGKRPAGQVTRAEIKAWIASYQKRSGWTAGEAFKVLRWAYARTVEEEILQSSPCAHIKKPEPKGPKSSNRVLSTIEVRAFWLALELLGDTLPADSVRLLALTGVRRGMALGAAVPEFDELDGQVGWRFFEGATQAEPRWTIPGGFGGRNKTGYDTGLAHVVPLSPQAVDVIKRRIAFANGECLFPAIVGPRFSSEDYQRVTEARARGLSQRQAGQLVGMSQTEVARHERGARRTSGPRRAVPMSQIDPRWVRLLKLATRWVLWTIKAGADEIGPRLAPMERWKIHGLRHTIATHMREDLGVPRNVVALILGHKQSGGGGATHIYDRAELLGERRAALVAWAEWLEAVAAGKGIRVLPMRR